MKTPLLIIGSSGHARVVIDAAERTGLFAIVGLIDRFRNTTEHTFGYAIVGSEEVLTDWIGRYPGVQIFVAIGDNAVRMEVMRSVQSSHPEVAFARIVHPMASVGRGVEIGEGSVVMAGAVLNPEVLVGRGVIVNTASSLDHECAVRDFASIGPGAVLGGNVEVAEGAVIAIGVTIKHRVKIGSHALVGAGALVLKDIPSEVVAYGTPAEIMGPRRPGDKYL
jgi:sugar O-acyltransferase (sialic acid O-acetyltransferase NeuD family)